MKNVITYKRVRNPKYNRKHKMNEMKFTEVADENLEKLAQDPKNIVYKYMERPPLSPEKVLSLDTVKTHITDLWNEVKMVRKDKLHCQNDLSDLQARQLRWWLLTKSPNAVCWQNFSETHPLIFDRCVGKDTSEKEITALRYMIFLKEKAQNGKLNNGTELLQDYMWNTFSMSEKEYRNKHGDDVKMVPIPKQ